jgi:hypothetical protein
VLLLAGVSHDMLSQVLGLLYACWGTIACCSKGAGAAAAATTAAEVAAAGLVATPVLNGNFPQHRRQTRVTHVPIACACCLYGTLCTPTWPNMPLYVTYACDFCTLSMEVSGMPPFHLHEQCRNLC